jgi:hypothetical protein
MPFDTAAIVVEPVADDAARPRDPAALLTVATPPSEEFHATAAKSVSCCRSMFPLP